MLRKESVVEEGTNNDDSDSEGELSDPIAVVPQTESIPNPIRTTENQVIASTLQERDNRDINDSVGDITPRDESNQPTPADVLSPNQPQPRRKRLQAP